MEIHDARHNYLHAGRQVLRELGAGQVPVPLKDAYSVAGVSRSAAHRIWPGGQTEFEKDLLRFSLGSTRMKTPARTFDFFVSLVEEGRAFEEIVGLSIGANVAMLRQSESLPFFLSMFGGSVTDDSRAPLKDYVLAYEPDFVRMYRLAFALDSRRLRSGYTYRDLFVCNDAIVHGFAVVEQVMGRLPLVGQNGHRYHLAGLMGMAVVDSMTEPGPPICKPPERELPESEWVVDSGPKLRILKAGVEVLASSWRNDSEISCKAISFGSLSRLTIRDVAKAAGRPDSSGIHAIWGSKDAFIAELISSVVDSSSTSVGRIPDSTDDVQSAVVRVSEAQLRAYRSSLTRRVGAASLFLSRRPPLEVAAYTLLEDRIERHGELLTELRTRFGAATKGTLDDRDLSISLLALADGFAMHADLGTASVKDTRGSGRKERNLFGLASLAFLAKHTRLNTAPDNR